MTTNVDDCRALEVLERRLRAILPEQYQNCADDVQPVSMGSATLKYGADGKVVWNEMWPTFCDLAMAGGRPHKGTLLELGSRSEVEAQPGRYAYVLEETCRGVTMVTGLVAQPAPTAGWVRVACVGEEMADWLVRAIVMENVVARREKTALDLPAAPYFRLEKEIKNVVTVMAKTCHYWMGHTTRTQKQTIATLFAQMAAESPFIEPARSTDAFEADRHTTIATMSESILRQTGLHPSTHGYAAWLGLECPSVRAAIWMMRALVVSNVLSRREGTVLFVPVNPMTDPQGTIVARAVVSVHGFASLAGMR